MSKSKTTIFKFNTYFDKKKRKDQYKNIILSKENISVKCFKGAMSCV